MPRVDRTDVGGHIYHVLNRANARAQIFDNDTEYRLFESVLEEGVKKFNMRLLACCIMPNHWHLILHPRNNGDLSQFMGWVTNTHTRRWHTNKDTVGQGHLYQGRYKSFLCQGDAHFLTLARYVERNALKANLVRKVEYWRWCSAWRREKGSIQQKKLLSAWPASKPKGYLAWLNQPQTAAEEEAIERSITRGNPYGGDTWTNRIIKKFKLESTVTPTGRPKKGG